MKSRRAFTLIELILVMFLLAVITAVTAPSMSGFFRGRYLQDEARRFLALTRFAHSQAISYGIPTRVWVDLRREEYGLQPAPGFFLPERLWRDYALTNHLTFRLDPEDTLMATNSLAFISCRADGGFEENSLTRIKLEPKDALGLWIVQSENGLQYEIQTEKTYQRRRWIE